MQRLRPSGHLPEHEREFQSAGNRSGRKEVIVLPDWYGEYDLPEERTSTQLEEGEVIYFCFLGFFIVAVPIVGIFYPQVYFPWKMMWVLMANLHKLILDGGGNIFLALFWATMIGPILVFSLFLGLPISIAAWMTYALHRGVAALCHLFKRIFSQVPGF